MKATNWAGPVLVIGVTAASSAYADDFTISGAATTTNNGETVDGNDSLTVTASGSVTTNGDGLYGTGGNNTLINNGTVSTSGVRGYGIHGTGGTNTLINRGTISTTGELGFAMHSFPTVCFSGCNGSMYTGGNSSITNSGTVTTSGKNGWGLVGSGDYNSLVNSGTVTTSGEGGSAFLISGNNNSIVNSGSVMTSGIRSAGLYAVGRSNTVTNGGAIIANQSFSIDMHDVDATVNLLEGSVLYGGVNFATAASATLNFGAGLNASVNTNNTIPNTITVANGSYVVAGSTIHAVDANSFAASDQTPGVMGGMILDTLDTQVASNPVGATRGASASNTGWIEGFGGQRRHEGNSTTMAFTSETYGVMAGRSLDALSGLYVGAARNTTASDRTFDNRSDSVFVGYYSRYDLGDIDMDASLTFGAAQNNTSRRIANNTVITGLETARGEYMSYFLMPSATFRGDWNLGETGFETSVRIRYTANRDQGYTETGSTAPMTVNGRTSHLGEVRLQVDGAVIDRETASGSFTANLRLGADAQYFDGDRVSGGIAGQSISFATNADQISSRAFAGLNISHIMADGTRELRGGVEFGRTQNGITDVSASIRWQMRF